MAAVNLKHPDIVGKCYEAAFYSKSTLNSYLRLFELPNYNDIKKEAARYIETLPEGFTGYYNNKNKQMMVNSLSKDLKDIIKSFNGEFDYIYDKYKNDKSTLGWSTEFKGVVVPLFILLLNKVKRLTKAKKKLIDGITQVRIY